MGAGELVDYLLFLGLPPVPGAAHSPAGPADFPNPFDCDDRAEAETSERWCGKDGASPAHWSCELRGDWEASESEWGSGASAGSPGSAWADSDVSAPPSPRGWEAGAGSWAAGALVRTAWNPLKTL